MWVKYLGHHSFSAQESFPDSKVHEANIRPIWVLSAPDEPHVGLMNLVVRVINSMWTTHHGIHETIKLLWSICVAYYQCMIPMCLKYDQPGGTYIQLRTIHKEH